MPSRDYAGNWPSTSRKARQQTHHRCCWCLFRRAAEVHHARYHCALRGDLSGQEVPGRDVFPLCDRCHGYLHRARFYLEFDDNSRNRNTRLIIAQLRTLYQIRRLPLEWLLFAAVGFTAAILLR